MSLAAAVTLGKFSVRLGEKHLPHSRETFTGVCLLRERGRGGEAHKGHEASEVAPLQLNLGQAAARGAGLHPHK